jgi:hypothetical protein
MTPEELFRQLQYAFESLPTPFARLIFLSSLRDPYTGRYMQEGWAVIATADEIHQALEEAQKEIFSVVVGLPLADFCRELREHFASLGQPEGEVARVWLETEPFRDMVPRGCSATERSLFVSQMRLALEMLTRLPETPTGVGRPASATRVPELPHKPRYLN